MERILLTLTGRDLSILKRYSPDRMLQPVWSQERDYSCEISINLSPVDDNEIRLSMVITDKKQEKGFDYIIDKFKDKKAMVILNQFDLLAEQLEGAAFQTLQED